VRPALPSSSSSPPSRHGLTRPHPCATATDQQHLHLVLGISLVLGQHIGIALVFKLAICSLAGPVQVRPPSTASLLTQCCKLTTLSHRSCALSSSPHADSPIRPRHSPLAPSPAASRPRPDSPRGTAAPVSSNPTLSILCLGESEPRRARASATAPASSVGHLAPSASTSPLVLRPGDTPTTETMAQAPRTSFHLPRAPPALADPSSPTASTTSSFLSRIAQFPLLGTGRSAKCGGTSEPRGRPFSFSRPKEGRVARSPPPSSSPAPPLKRSKSARSSLVASARRLSSSGTKRPGAGSGEPSAVASPMQPAALGRRDEREQPGAGMRNYRDRSQLFAMSSPELATPGEEKGEWAAWAVGETGSSAGASVAPPLSPQSPMVRWAADGDERTSFMPLSPSSMRPFATSAEPEPCSTRRLAETSSSPVGVDYEGTRRSSTHRARSPRAVWSVPALPTPLPSPAPPDEGLSRTTSRSPPLDEAVRAANRAEALFKLTGPTPAPDDIPDELAAFPFPAMSAAPPAPTRPLPSLPPSAIDVTSSTSLILPPTRTDAKAAAPPPLVRSNTVGLHPDPVPLGIDLKGRLVRARNSQPQPPPSTTTTTSPSLTLSSSPDSTRFSDWRPSAPSRMSSETSFTLSTEEDGELRPHAKSGLYALTTERRATESAVDVLAIVEEDELPLSSAPPLRPKRSPSKRGAGDSPQRRLSSSSTTRPRVSLDGASLHLGADVHIVPRPRPGASPLSSTPPRPLRPPRLSLVDRSLSSGAAIEPTSDEKDELGLRSQPQAQSSGVASSRPAAGAPSRPRAGKRCVSDLHADLRATSPDGRYGVGIGLPPGAGPSSIRTRHQSLALSGDDEEAFVAGSDLRARRASRRVSSGAATRTKLVLRENGKPVLTYVRPSLSLLRLKRRHVVQSVADVIFSLAATWRVDRARPVRVRLPRAQPQQRPGRRRQAHPARGQDGARDRGAERRGQAPAPPLAPEYRPVRGRRSDRALPQHHPRVRPLSSPCALLTLYTC